MVRRLACLAATAVFGGPAFAAPPVRVVAETEDLAAIMAEIGGRRVRVEPIFKGTQDPHDLATFLNDHPDRAGALEKADLYVSAGPTLDAVLGTDPFMHIGNGKIAPGGAGYLDASRGCRILGARRTPSRAEGTIHGLGSPHYWLDPDNGAIIARNIAEKLERMDAGNKDVYAAGLDRFLSGLRGRRARWAQEAAALRGFPVAAYRDSWGNLAEWLGLRVVETLEPEPGIAPSKARISEVGRRIKAERVGALLIEPYLDRKAADRAVRGTSAEVLVLAPSVGAAPGVVGYFDLFDHNLKAVAAAARASGWRP